MDDYGPDAFTAEYGVPRETMDRLLAYDDVLVDWCARMNLVAKSTIESRWNRHFRDSAQLFDLLPTDTRTVLDLGSGAGFPGLVLAAMGAPSRLHVTLIESTGKKTAFLAAAAKAMDIDVSIHTERIEKARLSSPPDVISARALAPLPKLLGYAAAHGGAGTTFIFPKGQDVGSELTDASRCWNMNIDVRPSRTNPVAQILILRDVRRKSP